ncbi:hypothetical protein ABT160_00350 [Streptomyces sp. NPDC001941]|uniref:hypothetical protein n=1 Tax=Streptomyces sp. NPDC001941 TaxID=3154659 RepID=UPI003318E7C6
MPLRTYLTLPRLLRHGSAVGADLPPDEAVVLDGPLTEELRDALAATARGAHRPARDLLAATRVDARWELRGTYAGELAGAALHAPGWLDAWLAEDPRDPDALLVKAELGVRRAWEVRTARSASKVSAERFRAFFALLEDAAPVIGEAARLNPADPVPWRVALTHAVGAQAPREVFDDYWREAVARSPHHYGCHAAALQYLCAKWYGSHEEMFAFAERAADEALPGSLLHALPLYAAVEHALAGEPPDARAAAAVARALELSREYPPGDPEAAGFRNHLALLLIREERWAEALEAFRAIGPHARSQPWARLGDPRGEFLEHRAGVRLQVAADTPFFGRPPAAPAPAPATTRALVLAGATPPQVAEAALMCGVPLRMAPAGPRATWVELVAGHAPGRRAALTGGDPLTTAADTFTTGEKWPALVLRRAPGRCALTLLVAGEVTATHEWDLGAPVPDHARATATARALAGAYRVADPRPLVALLRAVDAPAERQEALVRALGLPAPPPAFGTAEEVLPGLPGAGVLDRRGFLAGLRDTLADAPERLLVPEHSAPGPRGRSWWTWRILGALLFVPASGYAWWSPDVHWVRALLATLGAVFCVTEIASAWARPKGR